jgi:PTS system nitrogen regulatory IIA component
MELLIKDVVRLLSVPEDTVYRWIDKKSLPAFSINGQWRFNKVDLFEWATKSGIPITSDFLGSLSGNGSSLPSVAEALSQGGIYYDIKGDDKASVLRSVVGAIVLPPQMDRDFLLDMLLAREALGSTGVGSGIAIPHPRNPIVLNVSKPFLSLLFLEKPVDFESVDKIPVHALFTLISPTTRLHLHLLSRIAFLLHHQDFRNTLLSRAPADRILSGIARIESKPGTDPKV